MARRLTQKQETFCLKYFELGKVTEAALVAGYSPRTAFVIGSENLTKPKIIERIDQLRQIAENASIASVVERKQRLTEIVRADIPDFVEDGNIRVGKQSPNVGAVSEITSKTKVFRKGGEPILITNLKLHSPIQAIAELNKMERIYEAEGSIRIDNRTLIINVMSEHAKSLTQRLIEGERTGGDNSH